MNLLDCFIFVFKLAVSHSESVKQKRAEFHAVCCFVRLDNLSYDCDKGVLIDFFNGYLRIAAHRNGVTLDRIYTVNGISAVTAAVKINLADAYFFVVGYLR